MKNKVLIKITTVVVALSFFNFCDALAKGKIKTAQQQEKEFSQKEEDIKTIKKALKKFKSLEEKMQEKLKNIFKNFKKEDYEVKNYDLEVFFKNGAPILIYTHKKTGAQVFFNLSLDKEKIKEEGNQLIFRAPSRDDSGLTHFSEHCIASSYINYFAKKLKCTRDDINAFTNSSGLSFFSRVGFFNFNEKLEKEYVERLTNELKKPSVFEKDSKIFQVEKNRIINEIKDTFYNSYSIIERGKRRLARNYDELGKVLDLKKVNLKDFKNFFEEYIHPSNCLLFKNVFELNSNYIKNYLNLWHEKYFSYFKKKKVKNIRYQLKNKEKYLYLTWPKDSNIFSFEDKKNNKKQNFKYIADMYYEPENINKKKEQIFNLNLIPFEEDLKRFIKSLGYDEFDIFQGILIFYGNKKELFNQKVLEENYKKVMNFVSEKLKSLNEEDFLYCRYYPFKNYNKLQLDELNFKNAHLWSSPENFKNFRMFDVVYESFIQTGDVVSNLKFLINDKKEIESSYEELDKNIKKLLKEKFNLYDELKKDGPEYIDVFGKSEKNSKQTYKKLLDKYEKLNRVVPIKFKNKNSNQFVEDFAVKLFGLCLDEELGRNRGLIYKRVNYDFLTKNNFRIFYSLNKDSIKRLENYIFNNFDEIKKSVKVTKNDLEELKKRYLEDFKFFKTECEAYFKREQKMVKDLENYIKTRKIDENSELKKYLKIKDCYYENFPSNLIEFCNYSLLTFNKDFKDYKEYFEKEMFFKEKYLKRSNEKITPEFAKDFLENILKPTIKKLKNAFKLSKEKLKSLEKIEFLDVKNLIKTAYLVKDKKEIENDNLNINKKVKLDKEFKDFF